MKVSLVQMNSISDKAANIAAARALIERAVARGSAGLGAAARAVRLGGRRQGRQGAPTPRSLPGGPAYAMAQELAAKHRIFIHAGSIMEKIDGDERIHNTSVVFNREGEEIARYRKIHLFDVTTPDGAVLQGERDGEGGRRGRHLRLRGRHDRLLDLLRPALSRPLPGARREGRASHRPARRLHPADRQGPLGGAAARPRHRDGDLRLRQRPDRLASRSATSSARPTAIRWSPIPGAMSSPRLPTASASFRRGSTWPRSSACGG